MTCAYCDTDNLRTREHIFPHGLLKAAPTHSETLIGRFSKFVATEVAIKDVCAECNNVSLSRLDGAAIALFKSTFKAIVEGPGATSIQTDWTIFQRWLLKMAYNSARANHAGHELYHPYRKFILGKDSDAPRFTTLAQALLPTRIPEHMLPGMPEEFRTTGTIPPRILRISMFKDPRVVQLFPSVRVIALNSYYFYVVLPTVGESRQTWKRKAEALEGLLRPVTKLPRGICTLSIPTSDLDWLKTYMPTVMHNLPAFVAKYGDPTSDSFWSEADRC